MRILFYIPSLSKGGAERVVANLANTLSEKNDVDVLVYSMQRIAYQVKSRVRIIETDTTKRNQSRLARNIFRNFRLRKIVKNGDYDVVVSFLPQASFGILFIKNHIKSKVIVSVRNDPRTEYDSIVYKFLMRWLYKRADGFIFQTDEQRQYFSQSIQRKSTVIPNPINEDFLNTHDRDVKKEKIIINVGRLAEQKNQKLLVDSFNDIREEFPDYKLNIFGDGPLKEDLQKYIQKLGISDRVILHGISDDIKKELLRAKIFVLSSDYEGMPNALMEAMAVGLPCISTDCPCGGPRSLIKNNKNGILVPVNDRQALASAIKKVINNSDLAKHLGDEARRISIKLAPATITHEWEKFIQATVDAQTSPRQSRNHKQKGGDK